MAHQQQQQQQQQPRHRQHSHQQQQQPRSRPPPPSSSSSAYSPPSLPSTAPRIESSFESSQQPYYPSSNSQQQQQQQHQHQHQHHQSNTQYQSRPYQSSQQQNQPLQHSPLPPPPPLSDQNITIPKRGSSTNLAEFFSQSSFVPTTNTTTHARPIPAVQPTFDHPLTLQDIRLEPPQRSFANSDRPSSADRPHSVASFSNISTHSNDPLNPPVNSARKPEAPSKHKKKLSKRIMNATRGQQMQTARSITPQPWHPDYHRDSTHNPLDLPEHRRNGSNESSMGLNEIDPDDRNQDKSDGSKLHKTRKNIFARLRRSRTKTIYKVAGTGRTAQFSNERLYLHWIRFGILQGAIAVTLLSYGNEVAAWVGVGALVLALLTLVYSTTLYHTRHIHMITKRQDVVYFAKTIPTLLCVGLIVLYGANFVVTMSMGDDAASRPPWTRGEDGFASAF